MRIRLLVALLVGIAIFGLGIGLHSSALGVGGGIVVILVGAWAEWRATVAKSRLLVALDDTGRVASDHPGQPTVDE